MEKPPTATQPLTANSGDFAPSVQYVTAPLCTTPLTPVTPVTADAFILLRDLIVQQDAHALDDIDKQKLKRHMQKFTKGAQTLIVGGTLKQDRIQSLLKANDEAKPRRSTKSIVLSKAKVMSFEDLVEARIERAAKEANKLAKKKKRTRGRKRNGGQPEACLPEEEVEAAPIGEGVEPVRSLQPVAEIQHVEGLVVPGHGVAPIARMW